MMIGSKKSAANRKMTHQAIAPPSNFKVSASRKSKAKTTGISSMAVYRVSKSVKSLAIASAVFYSLEKE